MTLNWTKCLVCQTDNKEATVSVCGNNLQDNADVYEKFLGRVQQFSDIDALPVILDHLPSVEAVKSSRWVWHTSCRRKFDKQNLIRAQNKRIPRTQLAAPRPKRALPSVNVKNVCIFCKEIGSEKGNSLHAMVTYDMDHKVKYIAKRLDMQDLLAMLTGTDAHALDLKYHNKCFRELERKCQRQIAAEANEDLLDCDTLAEIQAKEEIFAYIEGEASEGNDLFSLDELAKLYEDKRRENGVQKEPIHRTRFKHEILRRLSHLELREEQRGKFKYLIGSVSMKEMIGNALEKKRANSSKMFKKAADLAHIIRAESTEMDHIPFNGTFDVGCQEATLSPLLLFFCRMLLNGPKAINRGTSQSVLSACQILSFNMKGLRKQKIEPPLPVYLGLYAHARYRSKELIDELHHLGLSISYARSTKIEAQLEHVVAQQARDDQVFCPQSLNENSFVIGAMDNADHNPSSTTAANAFHGTIIVAFGSSDGIPRSRLLLNELPKQLDPTLPASFINVLPFDKCLVDILSRPVECTATLDITENEFAKEDQWMSAVKNGVNETGSMKTWSAHHAASHSESIRPCSVGAFPLFQESSTDLAMIKHAMLLIQETTNKLNPGQPATIVTFDQPLFALAKKVQATFSEMGPNKFVVMLGGFHTEKAIWATIGDMLHSSGWVEAITDAGVTTSGRADSVLKSAHLTRTRYAHQVTLPVLHILLEEAYVCSQTTTPMDVWIQEKVSKCPTFKFWITVKEFQTIALMFVRAHREGNFQLYLRTLKRIIPLFFALDHTNYARWATVHLLDMESLPSEIRKAFMDGLWVIRKTQKRFSALSVDQALEQENKRLKASGGMIGLTENATALQRHAVVATVMAPLLDNFREQAGIKKNTDTDVRHHEETASFQQRFARHVRDLLDVIKKNGSPFTEILSDLVTLDGKVCLDKRAVQSLNQMNDLRKTQFIKYKSMISEIGDSKKPIPKNQLVLFKVKRDKKKPSANISARSFKQHASVLGQLLIAAQSRDDDIKEIFHHEIEEYPPAFSVNGKMFCGKKSDLLQLIKEDVDEEEEPPTFFDAVIIDGGNMIHTLAPSGGNTTFGEFAKNRFCLAIQRELYKTSRLDVVWDRYFLDSIKEQTREKRGTGLRKRVTSDAIVPTDFKKFLRVSENKTELFLFLSTEAMKICTLSDADKDLYLTHEEGVLHMGNHSDMGSCNHEEADTRVVIHLFHALAQGRNKIKIKTGDTDVVAILCGHHHRIPKHQSVWIEFGSGKNMELLSLDSLCSSLTPDKSRVLPMFHALTGCDTTSSFKNKGKRMFFLAWKKHPRLTEVLQHLADKPFDAFPIDSPLFKIIEEFVIKVYD